VLLVYKEIQEQLDLQEQLGHKEQQAQQVHKVIVLDYNTNFLQAPVAEIQAQAH
jgi:hypothetical protein